MSEFFSVFAHPIGIIGLIGQMCFFGRFVVQWAVSEKVGRSTVPLAFWYLSIAGSIMVLVYAIWQRDPVFTIGQSVGMIVYTRNIALIRRSRRRAAVAQHA